MTVLTDRRRTGAHVISEDDGGGSPSREVVTILTGAVLDPGTVLGAIAAGAASAAAKAGGNTGNGTISAVTTLDGVKVGVYKLRFTAATAWQLIDPEGFDLGNGANGVANANDLVFTTTAGGNAFVAGDGFDITVAAGSNKYVALNVAGIDGRQKAAAILWDHVDASDGDKKAVVHVRRCAVNDAELTWPEGISGPQKIIAISQLARDGVIVR